MFHGYSDTIPISEQDDSPDNRHQKSRIAEIFNLPFDFFETNISDFNIEDSSSISLNLGDDLDLKTLSPTNHYHKKLNYEVNFRSSNDQPDNKPLFSGTSDTFDFEFLEDYQTIPQESGILNFIPNLDKKSRMKFETFHESTRDCYMQTKEKYRLTEESLAKNVRTASTLFEDITTSDMEKSLEKITLLRKPIKKVSRNEKKPKGREAKNVVKNFAKQCNNFACGPIGSNIAREFLKNQKEFEEFNYYIRGQKKDRVTIKDFRNALLYSETEPLQVKEFKKLFQHLCVIFIQQYSHNWIFNSQFLKNKWLHLSLRNTLSRRISNPACFFNLCSRKK